MIGYFSRCQSLLTVPPNASEYACPHPLWQRRKSRRARQYPRPRCLWERRKSRPASASVPISVRHLSRLASLPQVMAVTLPAHLLPGRASPLSAHRSARVLSMAASSSPCSHSGANRSNITCSTLPARSLFVGATQVTTGVCKHADFRSTSVATCVAPTDHDRDTASASASFIRPCIAAQRASFCASVVNGDLLLTVSSQLVKRIEVYMISTTRPLAPCGSDASRDRRLQACRHPFDLCRDLRRSHRSWP